MQNEVSRSQDASQSGVSAGGVLDTFGRVLDVVNGDAPGTVEVFDDLLKAREVVIGLTAKLEQIERLSRTADPALVNVPAMLGDIARTALLRCAGEGA